MRSPRSALWRDRGFVRLFAAVAISELGSNVSFLALPLAALYILDASAFEVALLRTVEIAPLLLFALPIGVWVDRVRRRPLMVAADFGRAAVIASVPVAYWLGHFSLTQLYVVAAAYGLLTIFFDLSYLSFVPGLVPKDRLGEANSTLLGAQSAASLAGPTLAGALVGLVGAAVAVLADAVSFLCSGVLVSLIRGREPRPEPATTRPWDDLRQGVRFVFGQPTLRTLTVWISAWNLFSSAFFAILVVYYVRTLELSATTIGIVFAIANAGIVVAALVNQRLVARFGIGPVIAYVSPLSDACWLGLPLAPLAFPVPFLVAFGFLGAMLGFFVNVNQLTLRQSITPAHLLGRMNSVVRFMYWGTAPLGAVLGGLLADALGLRRTLVATALAALATGLPITFSHIRKLATVDGDAGAPGDGGVAATAR
jgi:predicted MFS family arabinose efflux permease